MTDGAVANTEWTEATEVERLRREVVRLRKQMGEECVAAAVAYDGSVQFLQNRVGELLRERSERQEVPPSAPVERSEDPRREPMRLPAFLAPIIQQLAERYEADRDKDEYTVILTHGSMMEIATAWAYHQGIMRQRSGYAHGDPK